MRGNSPETPFLDAFGIARGDAVAIVGSGGKATLMYRLAGEGVERGYAVVTTSTTHLHPPTSKQTRGFYVTGETPDWAGIIPRELQDAPPRDGPRRPSPARQAQGAGRG